MTVTDCVVFLRWTYLNGSCSSRCKLWRGTSTFMTYKRSENLENCISHTETKGTNDPEEERAFAVVLFGDRPRPPRTQEVLVSSYCSFHRGFFHLTYSSGQSHVTHTRHLTADGFRRPGRVSQSTFNENSILTCNGSSNSFRN